MAKYQVRQRPKSGNTWGAWTGWADTGTTPATATSHTATDLTPGTEYQFQVRGVTELGFGVESRDSNSKATTTPWDYPQVKAPQSLVATTRSEEVTLAWNPPETPVYGGDPSYSFTMKYQYRLSTDGGTTWNPDWTDVTGATGTAPIVWTATKLTPDTEYTIQVRGHIGKDDGIPAGLTTKTFATAGQGLVVDLDDDGSHDYLPGTFVLERGGSATFRLKYLKTSASPATLFLAPGADIAATGTGLHTDGTPVVTWAANAQDQWQTVTLSTPREWGSTVWGSRHEVEVLDAAGSSGTALVTIPVLLVGHPREPDGLTAEVEQGGVSLTWNEGAEGEVDDYRVRVSDDGGASWDPDWIGVGTGIRYDVGRLAAGADYLFEVGAVSARFGAGPAASVQATLPALPAAPASLTASAAGPSVALAWPDPEDPTITGWQYRHRFPGNADFGPWADMPGTGAGTTSHLVGGLRAATVYVFQVRAVNAAGGGGPSPEARATPSLPPVAFAVEAEVLDAAPGDTPKVRVRWRVNSIPEGTTWQIRRNGEYANWFDWVDAGAPAVDSTGRLSAAPLDFRPHGGEAGEWWQVRAISDGVPGAGSPAAFLPYLEQSVGTRSGLAPGRVRLTSSQTSGPAAGTIQYRFRLGNAAWGAWTDGGAFQNRRVDIDIEDLRTDAGPYAFQVRKVRPGNTGFYAFPDGSQISPLPGFSSHSPIVTATPLGEPPAPTGFRLTATRIPTGFRLAPFWDDLAPDVASRFKWQLRHKVGSGSFSNWIGDADLTPTVTRDVEVAGDAPVVFEFRYVNDVTYTEQVGPGDVAEATFDPPPAEPTGLSATAGNREIRLVWDDPGDPGIVLWQVRWKRSDAAGFGAWRDVPGSGAGTVEHTVGGLANGVGYDLQLRAVNANAAFFEGLESGTVSATPLAVPETPVGFAATAGDGTVALRWSSAGDASITGWQTRVRIGNGAFGAWVDVVGGTAATTEWRMTGLTNGTAYGFQLRAVNAVGEGLASATVTATPRALLVAPAGLRATPANGEVTLGWNALGNRSVIRFETRWRSSGSWSRWIPAPRSGWQTTSHTVTGLANGVAYRLELRAVNRNGPGPASAVSAIPIANIPAVTTGLVAQSGGSEAILSWRSARDPAIIRWELRRREVVDVNANPFILSDWGSWTAMAGASAGTRSWRVTGLNDGTIYIFQVRAVGAGGAGLPSGWVWTTPHPLPVAPNLSASNRDIGAGAIELKISEPRYTARLLHWQIRLRRDDADRFGPWLRVPPPASGQGSSYHVLRGLPGGVEHVVEARSVNSSGPGPAKEVRASALHPLDPPGNPAARADGDAAVLSWDAPPDDLGGALNWGARRKFDGGPWAEWVKIDGGTDVVRESGRLTWRTDELALDRTWTFELRADRSGGNKLRPPPPQRREEPPGRFRRRHGTGLGRHPLRPGLAAGGCGGGRGGAHLAGPGRRGISLGAAQRGQGFRGQGFVGRVAECRRVQRRRRSGRGRADLPGPGPLELGGPRVPGPLGFREERQRAFADRHGGAGGGAGRARRIVGSRRRRRCRAALERSRGPVDPRLAGPQPTRRRSLARMDQRRHHHAHRRSRHARPHGRGARGRPDLVFSGTGGERGAGCGLEGGVGVSADSAATRRHVPGTAHRPGCGADGRRRRLRGAPAVLGPDHRSHDRVLGIPGRRRRGDRSPAGCERAVCHRFLHHLRRRCLEFLRGCRTGEYPGGEQPRRREVVAGGPGGRPATALPERRRAGQRGLPLLALSAPRRRRVVRRRRVGGQGRNRRRGRHLAQTPRRLGHPVAPGGRSRERHALHGPVAGVEGRRRRGCRRPGHRDPDGRPSGRSRRGDGDRQEPCGGARLERSGRRFDHRLAVPAAARRQKLGRLEDHRRQRRLDHPP